MKKFRPFRPLLCLAAGAAALLFSSCAYDPYYSSSSVGTTYSSGYGQGYGYGGSSFNTSLFISTGDPRWGYDPSCYSYYDFRSRRYYDPHLNGFYPVGFRPRPVYGAPHPHGWRSGRRFIAPPSRVTNVTVNNYRNREVAYRNLGKPWSRNVRGYSNQQNRPNRFEQSRPNYDNSRQNWRDNQRNDTRGDRFQDRRSRNESPSRFNRPVTLTERPQRNSENWNDRVNRQQSPQLGNPGGDRNFNREQRVERRDRQQNLQSQQRQRFNQEAQQEARPQTQRPQMQRRQMEQPQVRQRQDQQPQIQRPQMQRRSEAGREVRPEGRGQRRGQRDRDGGEL